MVDRTLGPYSGRLQDTTQTGAINITTFVGGVATAADITLRAEGREQIIEDAHSDDLTISYLRASEYYLLNVRFIDAATRQPSPQIYSAYVQATSPANEIAVDLDDVVYGGEGGGGSGVGAIGISTV